MHIENHDLAKVMRSLFNKSPALLREFDRAPRARAATPEDSSSYLIMSPSPWAPDEMDADAHRAMMSHVGPDHWRLRAVDPRLMSKGKCILGVGGSCAIETWGMRLIERVKREGPEAITVLADRILAMAPTFTHATGALLTGNDISIHYVEDTLWTARLAEWGVSEASTKVAEAYQRIEEAVARRARLVNPEAQLLSISFDELALREGPLQRWMRDIGTPYDGSFGLAEVLYTYAGPEMRDIVLRILAKRGVTHLQDVTHIARLKQIDHCDWESVADRKLKTMILGGTGCSDELPYGGQVALSIARWVRTHETPSVVCGFFDTPYDATPMHATPYLHGVEKEVTAQIASCLRLHHGNIHEHLAMLEATLSAPPPENRSAGSQEKSESRARWKKAKTVLANDSAKRAKAQDRIEQLRRLLAFYEALLCGVVPSNAQEETTTLRTRVERMLEGFLARASSLTQQDEQEQEMGGALLRNLSDSVLEVPRWEYMLRRFSSEIPQQITHQETALRQLDTERAMAEEEVEVYERGKTHQAPPVTFQMYPLHQNFFVLYATQFLFDEDMRAFLHGVADVEQGSSARLEQVERIRALCAQIFPKMSAYLRYILVGGAYPQEARSKRLM